MKYLALLFVATTTLAGDGVFVDTITGQQTTRPLTTGDTAAITGGQEIQIDYAKPTEFPNGIAIPAATNGSPVYGIIATPDGDLVTYIDHASPRNPAAAASNRAASIVLREQIRSDLKTVRTNIATSIDNCSTNLADVQALAALTNGFSSAENRAAVNLLRSELIDANREMKAIAQELRDVRKAVSQMLREPNP